MMKIAQLASADLNLLVVFDAVFAERNVGRAARRLAVTPSAVSHGLGRLRTLFADPLFVRNPSGVVPTDRAHLLAAPIADILARTERVLSSVEPFDPATAVRRFVIGAPDGANVVSPLLAVLAKRAPRIDLGIRQILPVPGEPSPERAWQAAFDELSARTLDIAVVPTSSVPLSFETRELYAEDFVVVLRRGHPFAKRLTLARYCQANHLVVSMSADTQGFVDDALRKLKRSRRVALTVPSFLAGLALCAETDLISAMPRRFVAQYGPRFAIVAREAPLALPKFRIFAVAPRAALMEAGLRWLFDQLPPA
jgi:DNA-binding transcriptional LysR family regulator